MYENVNNSVILPVGMSWMKKTSVVIVEPGAKVNNEYHCEHFLRRGFLPVIHVFLLVEYLANSSSRKSNYINLIILSNSSAKGCSHFFWTTLYKYVRPFVHSSIDPSIKQSFHFSAPIVSYKSINQSNQSTSRWI